MKRLTALIVVAAIGIAVLQSAEAQTQFVGGYELTLTINSGPSPIPSGQTVYCLFTVTTKGDPSGNNRGIGMGVAAMNPAGTVGTCTVLIPYEWTLTSPGSNTVSPSYAVALAPKGLSAALALGLANLSFSKLPDITGVPASGTRTSLSATTRL
jgi:hypothetical protein